MKNIIVASLISLLLLCNDKTEDINNATVPSSPFYVNLLLHVPERYKKEYPIVWSSFQNAIAEWGKYLPVQWIITPFPEYSAISIHIEDIQEYPYNKPEEFLGLYELHNNRILLDGDSLENDPEMSYSVILHEMGHLLGLPHIVNMGQPSYTGSIATKNPEQFVMYHEYRRGTRQLSPIEIELAYHKLLYGWTSRESSRCELRK